MRKRALFAALMMLGVITTIPAAPSSAGQSAEQAAERRTEQTANQGTVGRVVPAAEDFVRIQYNDFLARQPDAAGLSFWARKIDNGEDPAQLIDSMVSAPEFAETVAPLVRLYKAYFLRAPDSEGLTFWAGRINGGTPLSQVSSTFAASPEFETRYGNLSDGDFINVVYKNVLGRLPEITGREFWLGRLATGTTRGSIMIQFSESNENVEKTIGEIRATMLYLGMLRRTPDPDGLTFWAGRIDSGQAYGSVVRGFLNSPEYQARLAALLPATNPLTGEATATAQNRPALAVKIGNSPAARPQVGIERADVVYEEMVEGNLSRLIVVFHSKTPPTVGPVRSVRTTDFAVLSGINNPLLAASGGNPTVLSRLRNHPIVDVTANTVGSAYRREGSRNAPYNLFANPTQLWAAATAPAAAPPFLFGYLDPGESLVPSAQPASGFDIDFGRTSATFRWNATRGGWVRTQDGSAHVDQSGVQHAPANVVVMLTNYITSTADAASPEGETVGVGRAWIYTAGQRMECFWSRSDSAAQIRYTDGEGRTCELAPGQTWVELAPPTSVTFR